MIATAEINISSNILAEIKAHKYFPLIPDKAANISNRKFAIGYQICWCGKR